MDLKLENAVAIVTGASSGLGFHTACRLLNEGAKVIVCSRSSDKLKHAYSNYDNNNLKLVTADITKPDDVKRLITTTIEHFQKLDILVTNGGGPQINTFEQLKIENWDEAYRLILLSCIMLIQEALPYLKKSTIPSILAIASITAKIYMPGFILSNVLRPAIIGLIKTLSFELGQYNIRINALLPGSTLTSRFEEAVKSHCTENQSTYETMINKIIQEIPLGRIGTPEEFANVAAFIASPMASYINGTTLSIDGGFVKAI